MARETVYTVMRDPDGYGWVIATEGRVARSLPFETKELAIEHARSLAAEHAPARVTVADELGGMSVALEMPAAAAEPTELAVYEPSKRRAA